MQNEVKLKKLNGRSLSSLVMKADRAKSLRNMIKIRSKFQSEVNEELTEINKSLNTHHYMTQRITNLFDNPYKKFQLKESIEIKPKAETLEDLIGRFRVSVKYKIGDKFNE